VSYSLSGPPRDFSMATPTAVGNLNEPSRQTFATESARTGLRPRFQTPWRTGSLIKELPPGRAELPGLAGRKVPTAGKSNPENLSSSFREPLASRSSTYVVLREQKREMAHCVHDRNIRNGIIGANDHTCWPGVWSL